MDTRIIRCVYMKTMTGMFVLLLGLTFFSVDAAALPNKTEAMPVSVAINKAGRQRMLTQRIVKAYCQIGLGVQPDKAGQQLQEAVGLFEAQLAELKRAAPNAEIIGALARVEEYWLPFRQTATGPVNRENAKKLAALGEELLAATHRTTLLFESLSGTLTGRLVNVAGRERMLSQRLAKYYMLMQLGFKSPDMDRGLAKARDEFRAGLQELTAARQNTPVIREELELAKTQWVFFENAMNEGAEMVDSATLARSAATSSERILEQMERVTALYEKLSI